MSDLSATQCGGDCSCNGGSGLSSCWIIIILLLFCGNNGNDGCGMGGGLGDSSCSCIILILLLLSCCGNGGLGGNGFGC
ncbi:MAG: chorion class high-cysteine HCB protein 13 [Lachnospiraceae bacterium]|nr:chorion class high-cysteine HCB protein 13 [Lachnospiraceae bacterium]